MPTTTDAATCGKTFIDAAGYEHTCDRRPHGDDHLCAENSHEVSIFPAHALKPGDRIHYDFRGGAEHLGDVEVFDGYPQGSKRTTLVLVDGEGRYHHRTVWSETQFEVK